MVKYLEVHHSTATGTVTYEIGVLKEADGNWSALTFTVPGKPTQHIANDSRFSTEDEAVSLAMAEAEKYMAKGND